MFNVIRTRLADFAGYVRQQPGPALRLFIQAAGRRKREMLLNWQLKR
jgi:hypothetical protein